ncbi:MAG: DASH family cryptochrome [Halobacteriales archaeon]
MTETALVWFRRDLRTHDNPTLAAAADADRLLPVSVFDPRRFGVREFGGSDSFAYRRPGPHRAQFLVESVADLRSQLRLAGSDLLVREGPPAAVLADLAKTMGADAVHASTYPTAEERETERAVEEALSEQGVDLHTRWTHTLHHPEDMADGGRTVDDTFTNFRRRIEDRVPVRDPVPEPSLPPRPDVPPGEIPSVEGLGVDPPAADDRTAFPFDGGESAGLARLDDWIWGQDRLRRYKETRNGLTGADYSSKLSGWLALGCLSPRRVQHAVDAYERDRVENDSTYWLTFELRWRDFFQFQFRKHGTAFWTPGGIRRRAIDWRNDEAALERWRAGQTGVPFVDAGMRELAATGYVSNRARQVVASFLANDLRIDWRRGAAHFERELVDYDPASNYGNWAYVAGVGNDSRDRSFDVLAQARRYDPEASFVKRWAPELADLPPEYAHGPWQLPRNRRREFGIELGTDYPWPLLDPAEFL